MNKRSYWVLAGPTLLFLSFVLLIYKTGFLLARPVWLLGIGLSVGLACCISYLIYQEFLAHETEMSRESALKAKEIKGVRSILEEAQHLYREKVDKLEAAFAVMEKEKLEALEEKESSLDTLKYEYEELNFQACHASSRADNFHVSLEDALEELRDLRQTHFFLHEKEKSTPRDLLNQHKQLREQFEEKSMILDQTRRRLFVIEGYLHALKQQMAMEKLDRHGEEENLVKTLGMLIEENEVLEKEVESLEKVISNNLNPPKFTKSKKQLQEILEFQFEKTT